jgi:hypothetical protein
VRLILLTRGPEEPLPSEVEILTPGSGIGFFPDPGSRIADPNPYFLELSDKFLGKKFYNSLKTGPHFFLQHLKNKIKSRNARHVKRTSCRRTVNSSRVDSKETLATTELQGWQQE